MPVPDYQSLMGPLLGALEDGEVHRLSDLRPQLAEQLGLTPSDLSQSIPSGGNLFASRLHWAATYMVQAGLVTRPRRGFMQITPRGKESLAAHGINIDNAHLSEFQSFRDFQARTHGAPRRTTPALANRASTTEDSLSAGSATPSEAIEALALEANASLAGKLLERVRSQVPALSRAACSAGPDSHGVRRTQHRCGRASWPVW